MDVGSGPRPRGLFVSFEGIDGAGKSSHVDWLADRWRSLGREVIVTREPGGTALGEQLRELVLHQPMHEHTELLLVAAARSEHLQSLIRPALARGCVVICDRYADSTFAYQGYGRGLSLEWIAALEREVVDGSRPDRTYLFDLPADVAARRRAAARAADRFETEDVDFFERVRTGYRTRELADPARFVRLDGTAGLEAIRQVLAADLEALLKTDRENYNV